MSGAIHDGSASVLGVPTAIPQWRHRFQSSDRILQVPNMRPSQCGQQKRSSLGKKARQT
jgi:hypothetical protein